MACPNGDCASSCYHAGSTSCTCGASCGSSICSQDGCTNCSGCKNSCVNSCGRDGCSGCSGSCVNACGQDGCTSCTGCTNTCNSYCNSGCAKQAAEQAYNSLQQELNDYIMAEDLKNIQLIFEAVKNRRANAGISTNNFNTIDFVKNTQMITAKNIQDLSNNATAIGFGVTDNTIIQNELFFKTTAEALRKKAVNEAYITRYGIR